MPQETNLSVSPYFDDFNINNNFFKVLFKPGYPIQARELTTLQSILQNQIEQFGKHIFKDGSPVIGGEPNFISPVDAIQINSIHNGIPVEIYIQEIIGKNIIGSISGVVAEVLGVLRDFESEKSNYTLYVKYIKGGGANYQNSKFFELEELISESDFKTYNEVGPNITIQAGQTIFSILPTGNITYQGSLCEIKQGIFFIRGYFVKTPTQRIITSQYSPESTYKIGYQILEDIVSADDDGSLYDNANGFNNYAAPGADRFRIDLQLTTKDVNENDSNFVELLRIQNGQPQFIVSKTVYSLIRDELASRTYDESGDYLVNPFTLFVRENLNDGYKSFGLYSKNQSTASGNTPSNDLLTYQIGPGKAYVNGYDIETISSTLIDVEKPRTTKKVEGKSVPYNAGSLVILNNVYGTPNIGLGATIPVSLMDSRLNTSKTVAVGSTIGFARVYDYIPEAQYVDNTSRIEVRLFDIDIFTKLTLSSTISLPKSSRIVGKISNASGFLKDSITSSKDLTLYSVSGTFVDNEPIIVNGLNSNRIISEAFKYNFSDVKSLYCTSGISTFSGDVVLNNSSKIGRSNSQFQISSNSSGISTVKSGFLDVFTNVLKSGDIISYNDPNFGSIPIYNKVESVSAGGTFFTISGITTVSGICNGTLPLSNVTLNNIVKIESSININDSSLVTTLPNLNINSIDLSNNSILQRRQFSNVSFSGSQITITITESDLFFADFDEDNFVISYSDGSLENIRSEKYNRPDGKTLTFTGLSKSSGTANVIATLTNINPSSIKKDLKKISSIIIDKSIYTQSGIGTTTLNDGLAYNQYYGLRIQDSEISLNVPDVLRVLAIYESSDINEPVLPTLNLTSFNGVFSSTNQLSIGNIFRGDDSNAVAIISSIIDSNTIEYVSLNSNNFRVSEKISFDEIDLTASINAMTIGSRNISGNYTFNNGHRSSIADYSRIIRKPNIEEPKRKLKIIYQNYVTPSTDTGEFITVNSYSGYDYGFDIPLIGDGIRSSDVIDLRPRVKEFTKTDASPFEYNGRELSVLGKYSSYVLAPNKNLIVNYDYYLPRVDVVSLNRSGRFQILQGIPSDDPKPPKISRDTLDIAVLFLPPYLYDYRDVVVNMSMHKRYRMSDISLLEQRIQKVEEVTSLNLLETKTQSIIIKDSETGLDRFKSGFFADDFVNEVFCDINNPEFKSTIYREDGTLAPSSTIRHLELQIGSESMSGFTTSYNPNIDHSFVTDIGSPNVKKSGQVVTLNYSEVPYISQPYANTDTNPSGVPIIYNGTSSLSPSEDIWYDPRVIDRNTFVEGETVTANTPTVENITSVVNQKGPDIIRYVDPPQSVPINKSNSSIKSNTNYSPSPSNPARYEGIATGNIPSTNSFGTVNQNVGGFDPSSGTNRTSPSIGAAGVERAKSMGYTTAEINSWVNRTGAIVGPEAKKLLGR
jgi:hypothetical protein